MNNQQEPCNTMVRLRKSTTERLKVRVKFRQTYDDVITELLNLSDEIDQLQKESERKD